MMTSAGGIHRIKPELDSVLNEAELEEVRRRLVDYIRVVEPCVNLRSPGWLLNDRTEPKWVTSLGARTRFVKGVWVGTLDVDWKIRLPDATYLTDSANANLLETCQDVATLYRDGYAGGTLPALTTWRHFCYSLKAFCVWIILRKARYAPARHGFALLDQQGLCELFIQIGIGGWTEAHELGRRCIEAMYFEATGEALNAGLDLTRRLPTEVVNPIRNWLQRAGAFTSRSNGRISRAFLGDLICADKESLCGASNRFIALMQQFEAPELSANGLLAGARSHREHPGHRTISLDAALCQPTSYGPAKRLAGEVDVLLRLHRHMADRLMPPGSIVTSELRRIARIHAVDVRRTPFMPVSTGMCYLDNALLWIERYGDALVDHFICVMDAILKRMREFGDQRSARARYQEEIVRAIAIPSAIEEISAGFHKVASNINSPCFQRFREQPTLHEAIEVLVGAIVYAIAVLKPPRCSEVTSLKYDCVSSNGNFYLTSTLAKRTAGTVRAETEGQPIPAIVAKAIRQMQRLHDGLLQLDTDNAHIDKTGLFLVPSREFGEIKKIHERTLDRYLDRFCDYVNLPLDELGRRWYARIHELRKWTLLMLFWSGREGVFEAARDLAGHTNGLHLQAYIALEFPGETLASLEALYVGDRLRTRTGFDENEAVFVQLYNEVLTHFKVGCIDLVPEREFRAYLRDLRERGEFQIRQYELVSGDGIGRHAFAFRKGRHDDLSI